MEAKGGPGLPTQRRPIIPRHPGLDPGSRAPLSDARFTTHWPPAFAGEQEWLQATINSH